MFQRVYHIPSITNADWMLLGEVSNQSSSVFLYAVSTFANATPALYAVATYNYDNLETVRCRLVVGETGGSYTPNIKYKRDGGVIKFWTRGSYSYSSELLIMTGSFKYKGLKEDPPTDAIQPSM